MDAALNLAATAFGAGVCGAVVIAPRRFMEDIAALLIQLFGGSPPVVEKAAAAVGAVEDAG